MKQQCYTAAHMYLFSIVVLVMVAKITSWRYIFVYAPNSIIVYLQKVSDEILMVYLCLFQLFNEKFFVVKGNKTFFAWIDAINHSNLNCLFMQCCYYESIAVQYA